MNKTEILVNKFENFVKIKYFFINMYGLIGVTMAFIYFSLRGYLK